MAKSVVIKGRNQSPAGRDHSPVKIRNENNIRINIGNTKGTKHKSKPTRKLSPEEINDLMEGQEEKFKSGSSSSGGSAVVYNSIPPLPPPPSAGIGILRDDFNQPSVANIMPNPHHRIPQFHSRAPEHNHQNPVLDDDTNKAVPFNYPISYANTQPVFDDENLNQGLHDSHEIGAMSMKELGEERKLEEERQRMLEDAHRRNQEDLERAKMFSRPELNYSDTYHNESEFEEQNPSHNYINISPLGELEREEVIKIMEKDKAEAIRRMEKVIFDEEERKRERERINAFFDIPTESTHQKVGGGAVGGGAVGGGAVGGGAVGGGAVGGGAVGGGAVGAVKEKRTRRTNAEVLTRREELYRTRRLKLEENARQRREGDQMWNEDKLTKKINKEEKQKERDEKLHMWDEDKLTKKFNREEKNLQKKERENMEKEEKRTKRALRVEKK